MGFTKLNVDVVVSNDHISLVVIGRGTQESRQSHQSVGYVDLLKPRPMPLCGLLNLQFQRIFRTSL